MRFGSTAQVLAKCELKYYRISECVTSRPRTDCLHDLPTLSPAAAPLAESPAHLYRNALRLDLARATQGFQAIAESDILSPPGLVPVHPWMRSSLAAACAASPIPECSAHALEDAQQLAHPQRCSQAVDCCWLASSRRTWRQLQCIQSLPVCLLSFFPTLKPAATPPAVSPARLDSKCTAPGLGSCHPGVARNCWPASPLPPRLLAVGPVPVHPWMRSSLDAACTASPPPKCSAHARETAAGLPPLLSRGC